MADERIEVEVAFTGTEAAAQGTDRVAQAVDVLAQRQTAAAASAIAFGQRLAAAASAVQGLVASLGVEGQTAGLIGRITQTSASMAQLGQTVGPQGALVGGIIGAVLPALASVQTALRETEERNQEWHDRLREITEAQEEAERAIRDATDAIDEQSEALSTASDRMRDFIDSLSQDGLAGQAFDTSARITTLTDQLADVNDQIARMGTTTGVAAAARLLDLRERAQQLTGEIATLSAEFGDMQTQVSESTAPRRAGRGESRDDIESGNVADFLQREADGRQAVLDAIEEQKRAEDELREQAYVAHQDAMREHSEKLDATRAQIELEEEAIERRLDAEKEGLRKLRDLEEAQKAQAQAQVEQYQQVTGVIVNGLTDALSAIISGQKSAEEAFKGLLAAFLNFISEQSALKAASEFAFAIADFASQNYSGGVQHLAAGVAFTAVAVAAGAGGAALSAPAAAAPQEGASSRDRDTGGGGGGTTVINWNAPIYTSSQKAEMGRELRGLVSEAGDRFGA